MAQTMVLAVSKIGGGRRGFSPLIIPALFWVTAFFLPLAGVLIRGLEAGQGAGLSGAYRRVWGFTLKQAGLSTLGAMALGLPGAALLGRYRFPGKRLLRAAATIPFVFPSLLAALGFVLVFGNRGVINSFLSALGGEGAPQIRVLYSLTGIVLAHVFYNFPLTLRIVGDAWGQIPQKLIRAAESLGASPWRIGRTIILPRLAPALLSAAGLTFLYCFLSFAIILVLGGGPQFSTLEVEVYRLITQSLDFSAGSRLALGESLAAWGFLGVYALGLKGMSRLSPRELGPPRPPRPLRGWGLFSAVPYLGGVFLFVLGPLLAIAGFSFLNRPTRAAPLSFTWDHWLRLFGGGRTGWELPLRALGTTAFLGLGTAAGASLTGALTAWGAGRKRNAAAGVVEAAMALPLGTSSVMLGLGYLMLARQLPSGNFPRMVSLVMVHTVTALPFVYYLTASRLRELPPRLGEAAASLGASPRRIFWTVDLPLTRRALGTAAVFAFALSAGELNATLILSPPGTSTLPLMIYQLAGSYDIFGACAMGTLLMLLTIPAFLLLDRWGEEKR